ncbi:hypothetical protein G7K_1597-t1 [Saitoella complicata NRRL Y-17804]|uniref:CENP-V/GFA domain-containing protein n=1 Tax=Saitoella complicata (strain BCRC 22490 / CBS 7301 / JCM 7358 / NBRC 10748 / NRRL Y-17804) TaxID=698492 RepID=A0A0E9NC36_SAICN|nr:hypothetical protein G7K_1597-t1 [Saitoella complicata NRRL Y-17804]
MNAISGSCNCGQITVKLDKKPDSTCLCHCTDCQRFSGAPMSGNFIVQKDEVHIEGPVKRWAGKGASGNAVERYFCPNCV